MLCGCRFSGGIELAPFVTSSGVPRRSWDASRHANIVSNVGVGISWKVNKEPDTDVTIVAFEATPPDSSSSSSNLRPGLVSSFQLREKGFLHFEFLCTKKNPIFSLNSTAVSLFCKNYQRLLIS